MSKLFTISPSPHIHSGDAVNKIMYGVILALVPAFIWSVVMFGLDSVRVTLIAVAACMAFELLIQKFILKVKPQIADGSAALTGVLLAFNVPASVPSWMLIVGALVSIGIAKMPFGGLGNNPFNPALVGRVFMLISFPVQMTSWPAVGASGVDAVTTATPLAILKEGVKNGQPVVEIFKDLPTNMDLFVGNMAGSLGEISALALIIGGIFMLVRKIITWHIPVSVLLSAAIFSGIFWMIDPAKFADPIFHLITGGMILGAFFMATDMVTSPMNPKAQIIFGAGIGILTILIRLWGAYPEGVSFAILIMNAMVPLLNRYVKPKRFGEVKIQSTKG
ncbi:MAG: Na+-transporting NADH:ubiquinone oxidoreductase subunit D [Bacteroidetes bacterium GWB2_41_8]|nr:MAG: Na+-transporting NADH:ubiquinone oxidoreductase subunit D [Bacteroidetes bacterium GWB2_41_8]